MSHTTARPPAFSHFGNILKVSKFCNVVRFGVIFEKFRISDNLRNIQIVEF